MHAWVLSRRCINLNQDSCCHDIAQAGAFLTSGKLSCLLVLGGQLLQADCTPLLYFHLLGKPGLNGAGPVLSIASYWDSLG